MKRRILTADVLENTEIAPGIWKLTMYSPEAASVARSGQFLNLYPDADRLILPRPFGIHDASRKEHSVSIIYEVVGEGTREMAEKVRGDRVRISEPLGNGFDLSVFPADLAAREGASAVLVGGGVGVSVLQLLARELSEIGVRCTAVTGFREYPFAVESLEKMGCRVLVTTDVPTPTAFLGNVCDCMALNEIHAEQYFACGPHPMLRAVDEYVKARSDDRCLQVSLDGRMGCGYGVCLGCSISVRPGAEEGRPRTQAAALPAAGDAPEPITAPAEGKALETVDEANVSHKRVCKDGPVFRGNEVIWT